MTDQQPILTPDGQPFDWRVFHGYDGPPAARYDGWTPDRQRIFLEALSHGHSIVHACRIVGMTRQSAYALRRAPRGAAFALAWQAATLLQREALADTLMDRALNGVEEWTEQDDGRRTTRLRHDNRLGMAMLTRLDNAADTARAEAGHAAARLIAQEFEQYLDLIGRDAGPARAGLFLAARLGDDAPREADEADLAPIRALARADRWLRTHTGLAGEVETADLDPDARAGWTAEQWTRAEAAGLVQLAPPEPEPEDPARDGKCKDCQLPGGGMAECDHVWWEPEVQAWRTWFPPPPGFDGFEYGRYGDDVYFRALTPEEFDALDTPTPEEIEARREVEAAERDAYFGFKPARDAGDAHDFEDEDEAEWDEDDDRGDAGDGARKRDE